MATENALYYGDNLDVLRRYVPDEAVDLVYLDPPFNSNASYNVLFGEADGSQSSAQVQAFEDTWHWAQAAPFYEDVVDRGGQVGEALEAFRQLLGRNDMLAYLSMMAPRLVELHRVLKPTGSLYLHCDPTASHYLKVLLDAIFGPDRFRTEITWKRSSAHSDTRQGRKQHGRIHDVLLFYTRGETWTWNPLYTPYDSDYLATFYRFTEPRTGRRYRLGDLTAARPGGDTRYEWRVKRTGPDAPWEADLDGEHERPAPGAEYLGVPPYKGRFWAYSRQNMAEFARSGRLYHTSSGVPCYKRYLDEMPGVPLQDMWTDIPPIGAGAAERLGYPTQKPEALLRRIIESSSNEGDMVLDPFCGCGTAVVVAERLARHWIGIDITCLATNLIKRRLHDAFGDQVHYRVLGEPVSVSEAQALAGENPYQFQYWALGLVDARPADPRKGADQGIDGRLPFRDDPGGGKMKHVVLSVKSGKTGVAHLRDLRGVLDREKADIGVLITMHAPTPQMVAEAASAGFYHSRSWGTRHPRMQILTVAELLEGRRIDMPPVRQVGAAYKRGSSSRGGAAPGTLSLFEDTAVYRVVDGDES